VTERNIRQIKKSIAVRSLRAAQLPIALVYVPFEGEGLSDPKVALAIEILSRLGLFILLGFLGNGTAVYSGVVTQR